MSSSRTDRVIVLTRLAHPSERACSSSRILQVASPECRGFVVSSIHIFVKKEAYLQVSTGVLRIVSPISLEKRLKSGVSLAKELGFRDG